jgi:hypothetical protein
MPGVSTVLKITIRKVNLIRSAIFALLGVVGWWGTVTSRGDRGEQSFFAFLWALSVVGATGFLAIPLMQQISERSSRPDAADSPWPIVHGDYVARHSIRDKMISACLAAAGALITTFLFYHQTPLLTRTISSAMSCFFFWYAYRVCLTAVRFTSQEITIRIIPFVCFSEKCSVLFSNYCCWKRRPPLCHLDRRSHGPKAHPRVMKNGSCSATTVAGSAALPFVISTGEVMGQRPTQGDEKRVLFSNYCCWKRRPPLCHLDRSSEGA